jgi:gas vesicle protein
MDDTCFDLLCKDLTADEAKVFRKMMAEWSNGDENGFPVQFALLTRVQWRAVSLVPQAVNESRKLIELHLAEYRRQTAELIKNLSAVCEDQTDELKNVVEAHTETVKQASVSIQDQLRRTTEAANQIRKQLDDGVSAWNRAKTDMEAGREMFQKACKELDDRITLRELRRDWLTLLGVISIGIVIGVVVGIVIAFKYR